MTIDDLLGNEELMAFYENTVDEQIAFTHFHESLFDEMQTTNTHTPTGSCTNPRRKNLNRRKKRSS